MNIFKPYQKFWRKGLDFSGISSKQEYWIAISTHVLIIFILDFLESINSQEVLYRPMSGQLLALYLFASTFPCLTITVRRLRDSGRNWPWILLMNFPLVGQIWLIILLMQPSLTIGGA